MSSSVYYKFKSQRDETRVQFDGTGISVYDLKKQIIIQNNLKASDIDLLLYDSAGQEYKDDTYVIPRSTSVIAKRMPAVKPGRGRAAIYVANMGTPHSGTPEHFGPANGSSAPSGGMMSGGSGRFGAMSRRFDGRDQKAASAPTSSTGTPTPQLAPSAPIVAPPAAGDDEAASIAAMFAESSEQWAQTQEQMAHHKFVNNRPFQNRGPSSGSGAPHASARPAHQPDTRPLPPGYICHRCNKKGHWIQDCPTNDDREYDNRPRMKRTTGIPRSFLKTVEFAPGEAPTKGVMVTPEGGFVVAEPDSAAWERQRNKARGLTEAEVKEKPPSDPALACPYPNCGKLLRDAVKTPCCQTSYCEECIHTHLLEGNFECPKCKSKIPSLDKLKIDSEKRAKVREYVRETVERSRREAEESAASDQPPAPVVAPTTATSSETKEEEYMDQQPGNDGSTAEPAFIDPNIVITQLQAQLAQLMIMQSNPTLPPANRINVNNQIQQLTFQLKQAEAMRDMLNMMNGGGMNMNMMMNGMGMMGMGVPNMGMGMPGYGQQQQWGNQFPMQQPPPDQSAYDRLPINNRRPKRERPEDFGNVGPDSKRQYWE